MIRKGQIDIYVIFTHNDREYLDWFFTIQMKEEMVVEMWNILIPQKYCDSKILWFQRMPKSQYSDTVLAMTVALCSVSPHLLSLCGPSPYTPLPQCLHPLPWAILYAWCLHLGSGKRGGLGCNGSCFLSSCLATLPSLESNCHKGAATCLHQQESTGPGTGMRKMAVV